MSTTWLKKCTQSVPVLTAQLLGRISRRDHHIPTCTEKYVIMTQLSVCHPILRSKPLKGGRKRQYRVLNAHSLLPSQIVLRPNCTDLLCFHYLALSVGVLGICRVVWIATRFLLLNDLHCIFNDLFIACLPRFRMALDNMT